MSDFSQRHKYHIALFIILLLTTAASGGYLLTTLPTAKNKLKNETVANERQSNNFLPTILTTTQQLQTKTIFKIEQSPTFSSSSSAKQPLEKTKNSIIANCQQNCLSAKIKTENTTYDLRLTATTTVYDAMRLLQQNSDFSFNGKDYGGLGFFVEEINGLKNNQQASQYWIYYINGESAKVGVSNYILKSNDIITWKYENYK